jgi:hypothetical protein
MGQFTEIEVPSVQLLERRIDGLLNLTVVGVGKLGCDEYLLTGNTGRLNPNADLRLIPVFGSSINMTIS